MISSRILQCLSIFAWSVAPLAYAADPVISNLTAAQRAGTQLVDIAYDVTADSPTVQVTLAISSDGGTTYSVPVVAVSGAVGSGVATGTGKVITWNAGADWNKQYSPTICFKVTADDLTLAGFSYIPAGSFQMGNAMVADTDFTNAPIRTVTVSAFYMGQNLVTKADWDAVQTWGLSNGYTDLRAGSGKAANHPVDSLTWYDMVKWCNAKSEKEGLTPCYTLSGAVYRTTNSDAVVCNWAANGYRLPTEAEWEKAARGGLSGQRFPWGNTISEYQANYDSDTTSYDSGPYGYNSIGVIGGLPYTSPVGSFAANGYGLYDMAGNLNEWCWDWYGTYAAGAQTDPHGASSGSVRVWRGGEWDNQANSCRVAFRDGSYPTDVYYDIGFRAARTVGGSGSAITSNVTVDTRSAVSTLSSLVLSSGTLSPTFASGTLDYNASVSNVTTAITLTPTVTDATATVQVNGTTVASGAASPAISLNEGSNTLTVLVTAQDGTSTSYSVTVTKLPLTVLFTSASTLPVTSSGYSATGSSVGITLGFAPPVGTSLTIVNNTGPGFIVGRFSNLSQGQAVSLAYNNATYHFIANYYGGTGNDLVLQWADTSLYDWGCNVSGQLGNGNNINSKVPVEVIRSGVLSGKTPLQVAVGDSHGMVLCSDGTVATWGLNGSGQLGNGNNTGSKVPVLVDTSGALSGKTVVAVAASDSHSMALCSDGTVAAWGDNSYGKLGNNSTSNSNVPVAVNTAGVLSGKTVVAVASGADHCLALCSDGTMAAWGLNDFGQLGNGNNTNSSVPVAVTTAGVLSGKTVIAIAAGYSHSLALCSDGTAVAWGGGSSGQLGNNSYNDSNVPVAVISSGVLAGKTVSAMAAGNYHSLALCSDGSLVAWGDNSIGQLGNGGGSSSSVPVAVATSGALSGKTVNGIAAGDGHSLAVCSDGTAAAWGYNYYGQLGTNNTTDSSVPVAVSTSTLGSGEKFVSLAAGCGADNSLAIITIPPSGNSALSALAINPGSLSPAFAATTMSYTASVATACTSVTLTPTVSDANESVTVNGTAVTSGTASQAIGLTVGANVITVVVMAQNGTTTTYTVTITHAPSTVCTLSGLTLGVGTLSPAFDPSTTAYVARVPAVASSVQIAATTTDPTATIQMNGTTVASGVVSAVPLSAGVNTIPVVVTAQDGITARTTTVTIDNSAFGVWKSGKFTGAGELANAAISGDMATPAHDGITNLMKYAMALEPKADGSGSMPVTGTRFGYMTFTYRKNKTAADATYTVQSCDSLTGIWTTAATVTSQSDQGAYTLVTVRDTVPLAGHPHRFMRLQVSR